MTLSEFKGWFEGFTLGENYLELWEIEQIKENLASVEDGSANEMKEITCPCCDALFNAETTNTLAKRYHNAAINHLMNDAANVPRGTLPEIAPVVELCHYCKKPLFLVMPHVIPPDQPLPEVGVCSVCHLYQP